VETAAAGRSSSREPRSFGPREESCDLFRGPKWGATVRFVIVLVGLIAVLVLAWLLLRGRHLDA
jgi:hypothetical protein